MGDDSLQYQAHERDYPAGCAQVRRARRCRSHAFGHESRGTDDLWSCEVLALWARVTTGLRERAQALPGQGHRPESHPYQRLPDARRIFEGTYCHEGGVSRGVCEGSIGPCRDGTRRRASIPISPGLPFGARDRGRGVAENGQCR